LWLLSLLLGVTVALGAVSGPPLDQLPRVDKAVLSLALSSAKSDPALDTVGLEPQLRDWLHQRGLKLVEATSPEARQAYRLQIEVMVHHSEDGLFWHAVSVGLFRPVAGGKPVGVVGSTAPNPDWQTSHLLAQKGPAQYRDHLDATLHRSLEELLGDSFQEAKAENRRWLRWAIRPVMLLPDPSAISYTMEVPKVQRQPPPPAYPAQAKAQGIQGTVVVGIVVDATGAPLLAEALSGPRELLETATRYALGWEFEPATLNGVPRGASFRLTMPFKLN
jgi:TonB family protein